MQGPVQFGFGLVLLGLDPVGPSCRYNSWVMCLPHVRYLELVFLFPLYLSNTHAAKVSSSLFFQEYIHHKVKVPCNYGVVLITPDLFS